MKKHSERVLFEGKWLSMHELLYIDKEGRSVAWEIVRRRNVKAGVVIIAKMVPSGRFILIKQFRPALNGYVLAFPAGLAYGDPTHALVELKEETGYTGEIISISPVIKTGSTIIDDNGQIVFAQVDEALLVNQNPQQQLEEGEDIEVCLVHAKEMRDFILDQQKQGVQISSNLWYMFMMPELYV